MIYHASEMPRLVLCPGSKGIQAQYPYIGEDQSAEGTVAHGIAAEVLKGERTLESYLNQSINNVYIDAEFLSYVEPYVDECAGLPDGNPSIEDNYTLNASDDTLSGTPDYCEHDVRSQTLYISDLKFGYSWVEVYENWQLLAYAVLAMEHCRVREPGFEQYCKHISLTIIQPRANHPDGPVRNWTFDADLLRGYRNKITGAMERASLAKPPICTGTHCRYCKGLLHCHGAQAATGYALEYAGTASHSEITPEQVALELEVVGRASKMLSQRLAALEEYGLSIGGVPGWEAHQSTGNLAWTPTDPIAIGDAMGVDLRGPVKPVTPTQAIARKILTKDTVAALASRPMGGMKLKRTDPKKVERILNG
jgi:hypothetical protein